MLKFIKKGGNVIMKIKLIPVSSFTIMLILLCSMVNAQSPATQKHDIPKLIQSAQDLKKEWHIKEALAKYIEGLVQDPLTVFIYDIHWGVKDCLEKVQPTTEAKKIMTSGDKKLIKQYGRTNLERSGLEELLQECDNIILDSERDAIEKMVYKIIKGYIYLTARYSGSQPPAEKNINKAIEIFREVINTNKPVCVLHGLVGYSLTHGYKTQYNVALKRVLEETEELKVFQEIINKFPNTKQAAFAQKELADWYIVTGKHEKAAKEIERLLEYPDFEIEYIEHGKGKRTLHGIADAMKKSIQKD